jgi:hypothetical protein
MAAVTASWATQAQYGLGMQYITKETDSGTVKGLYTVVRLANHIHQFFFTSVEGFKALSKCLFTSYDWADFLQLPSKHIPAFANVAKVARTVKNGLGPFELASVLSKVKPLPQVHLLGSIDQGRAVNTLAPYWDRIWEGAASAAGGLIPLCDTMLFCKDQGIFTQGSRTVKWVDRITPWGYFGAGVVSSTRMLYKTGVQVWQGYNIDQQTGQVTKMERRDYITSVMDAIFAAAILCLSVVMASPGITSLQFGNRKDLLKHVFYTTMTGLPIVKAVYIKFTTKSEQAASK